MPKFVEILSRGAAALLLVTAGAALADGAKPIQLTAGSNHTCALMSDHSLKCWGYNGYGELGLGDSTNRGDTSSSMNIPAIDLGAGRSVLKVTAGAYHTCAILDDHSLKCWGNGDSGQLGQGSTDGIGYQADQMGDKLKAIDLGTGRTAIDVAAGYEHTCAILDDHSMKCWGLNDYGQLGLGDYNDRGHTADTMGDKLLAINLGTGRTAVSLAVSYYNTCAILDNGTMKCWGYNGSGQLGLGDTLERGDQANQMGDSLPAIDVGNHKIVAATVGAGTICATLDDTTQRCWGENGSGQLGEGTTTARGSAPGQMGDLIPALNLAPGLGVRQLQCGSGSQCCAVLSNNAMKCWGYGGDGYLGLEDFQNRGDQPSQMGDNLPFVDMGRLAIVRQIAVGSDFTCAIMGDLTVKCFGDSYSGECGAGDSNQRGGQPGTMGDTLKAVPL